MGSDTSVRVDRRTTYDLDFMRVRLAKLLNVSPRSVPKKYIILMGVKLLEKLSDDELVRLYYKEIVGGGRFGAL